MIAKRKSFETTQAAEKLALPAAIKLSLILTIYKEVAACSSLKLIIVTFSSEKTFCVVLILA